MICLACDELTKHKTQTIQKRVKQAVLDKIAPKDPTAKRPGFYVLLDKPVGGLPSNDGVGHYPVYINDDRLVTFAKMVGGIDDENILEMLRTAKGFRKLVHSVGVSIVGVVALALLGGPVVGILMPFILAFIMAWMFNPVIAWLQRHLRLTRRLFSYILVLVFYALLFGLCLFFAGQLISQAVDLARSVPGFIADLQGLYNELITWLQEVLSRLPAEYASVGDEIFSLLNSAWEWLKTLLSGALGYVMSISRNVALEVPNFVIFLTVLVLASCIITADFPNLRENIYGYLGVRGKNSVRLMGHSFRAAVFGFFRSQLIFALLDMGIILVAFFIIGVSYPLPIALVLAFLDFIPFFGAGTVLVPWGLICMAIGLFDMGWKLLLLYGILYIIRRIFEPRILGGATGFSSLQMLFSMYAGMRIAGVTGLVVAPIVWITGVNFFKTGVLDGVMSDIRFVANDIRKTVARPVPTKTQEPPTARPAAKSGEKKKRFSFGKKNAE